MDEMRIKCFTMSLLLVAGALLFGESNTRLMAQESTGGKRVKISEVDVADLNSDGKVTTDELKEFLAQRYLEAWAKKVDANQNGEISKWEFRLARKALEQLFAEENKAVASMKVAKPAKPLSSIDAMNMRFFEKDPKVGTTIESLIAFNEEGEEVNFKDFRGKHVVLVFGCLT